MLALVASAGVNAVEEVKEIPVPEMATFEEIEETNPGFLKKAAKNWPITLAVTAAFVTAFHSVHSLIRTKTHSKTISFGQAFWRGIPLVGGKAWKGLKADKAHFFGSDKDIDAINADLLVPLKALAEALEGLDALNDVEAIAEVEGEGEGAGQKAVTFGELRAEAALADTAEIAALDENKLKAVDLFVNRLVALDESDETNAAINKAAKGACNNLVAKFSELNAAQNANAERAATLSAFSS